MSAIQINKLYLYSIHQGGYCRSNCFKGGWWTNYKLGKKNEAMKANKETWNDWIN